MKIKYSFVCDAANIAKSGNLNVLGIFQNIHAIKLPWKHPKFMYVASVKVHRSEFGKHSFQLNFIDEDGNYIINPIKQPIIIKKGQKYTNIIITLTGVTFNKPGTYAIDLLIDGHHVTTDTIEVTSPALNK